MYWQAGFLGVIEERFEKISYIFNSRKWSIFMVVISRVAGVNNANKV